MNLYLDLESFSECDLRTRSLHRYAEDPSTEVTIIQWALDESPIVVEDLTGCRRPSGVLLELIEDPTITVVIHNSAFDRTVMRHVWGVDLAPERVDDTMVRALAHGMPGGLDKLGVALGLPQDEQKDNRGRRLIQLFCKPFKGRRATRDTHPHEWAEFLDYSAQDIVTMRAIHKRLPGWNYRPGSAEHALWALDQRINERGFAVDQELAQAALAAVATVGAEMADEVATMTGGEVSKATRREAMLSHILEWYGVKLPDMKKDTLQRRIDDESLPAAVRQLIAIRLEAAQTSAGKYRALLNAVSADGRLRGTLQFCGANRTGRWSGRVFQPQNLMRPTMPADDINDGIELLKAGCAQVLYPQIMTLAGNAVRGCIVAPKGKKLVVSDLSSIEGRGLVGLSGEQWKLDTFAAGADTYVHAYARSFGIAPEAVDKDGRQIGKTMELALGYGGGVAAFTTFAAIYGLDLDRLADAVHATASQAQRSDAAGMWGWAVRNSRALGLSERVYTACEILKKAWRDAHPKTVDLWQDAQSAFHGATITPGAVFSAGPVNLRRDGSWLRARLPSGRYLCYFMPQVDAAGVSYMGVNPYTRQWGRIRTWGGSLVENFTQAWARDVLAHNMPAIEVAGYPIVLTVHDEVITEVPDSDDYSAAELSEILAQRPPWAAHVPLAAAGFETHRYRK